MRRVVCAIVIASLIALPAALANGLPQWTGCHGEVQITQTGDKVACVFAQNHLYQHVRFYTRSLGGAHVAGIEWVEVWHADLGDKAATRTGLRDIDSLKRYYRVEYANKTVTTDAKGVEHVSFITVWSGPDGLLIEIMTLIPVAMGPTVEGDEPTKEAAL